MTGADEEDAVHPLRRRVQALEFDGDTATARRLTEEGQRTIDKQLDALDDIDAKAIAILKLDLVIVSATVAIGSFASESAIVSVADLGNAFNLVAITSLVVSAALAASTYTASDTEVGMESTALRDAIDADLTEREFEVAVAQSYAAWIEFNDQTNVVNSALITLTTLLVVVAVVHLSLGVYAALVGEHVMLAAALGWGLLGLVASIADLTGQVDRAYRELSTGEDLL